MRAEIASLKRGIADSESERLEAKKRLFEAQSDRTTLNSALGRSLDRVVLLKYKVKSLKKEVAESSVCCECQSVFQREDSGCCSMCHEKWCDCGCYYDSEDEDGECVYCKSACCTLHSDDEHWDVSEYC